MSGHRTAALVGAGLALLVPGAVLYVIAGYIGLGLQVGESEISRAWAWPLALTGAVLMLAGPAIFWVIIPFVYRRRRRREQ